MQVSQRPSKSKSSNTKVTEIAKQAAVSCKARHALSVTVARGHGLIYFEPLVTGGETIDDVDSLYCIAKNISKKLSGGV
jgi:hypothetical protein